MGKELSFGELIRIKSERLKKESEELAELKQAEAIARKFGLKIVQGNPGELLLEPGRYTAILESVEPTDLDKFGVGLRWTFRVFGSPAAKDERMIMAMTGSTFSPKFKTWGWLTALGVKLVEEKPFDLQSVFGLECQVILGQKPDKDNPSIVYNVIDAVLGPPVPTPAKKHRGKGKAKQGAMRFHRNEVPRYGPLETIPLQDMGGGIKNRIYADVSHLAHPDPATLYNSIQMLTPLTVNELFVAARNLGLFQGYTDANVVRSLRRTPWFERSVGRGDGRRAVYIKADKVPSFALGKNRDALGPAVVEILSEKGTQMLSTRELAVEIIKRGVFPDMMAPTTKNIVRLQSELQGVPLKEARVHCHKAEDNQLYIGMKAPAELQPA